MSSRAAETAASILLVEDKDSLRAMLRLALEAHGHAVIEARDEAEAVAALRDTQPAIVLSDLRLPVGDGLGVLRAAKDTDPELPVIVMTAHGSIQDAVAAMKQGALDFLAKPVDPDHLILLVERALAQRRLLGEYRLLKEEAAARRGGPHIIGDSPALRQVMTAIDRAAATDTTVLLEGESGTGKELCARALHDRSARASGPFVAINCAAIPDTLLEAELFGYERGAFSGAQEGRAGLLELARGGTFFLDEVGDMPQEVQAKLLKCLDEREYYPLGGREPRAVDCAIVTATNRDLERDAAGRRFRQDLYYRLSTYVVRIPPLRERPEDMLALAQRELDRLNGEFRATKRLTPVSMSLLQSHPFPGNVRELSNLLKKAVIIAEGDQLDAALAESLGTRPAFIGGETGLEEELAAVEREILLRAAARCRTTRQMAEYLGVSQPTVVRKMARHGVHLPEHGKGRPSVRVLRE